MTSSDDQTECPLCMEMLEVDDLNFYPCTCGYQICRFCWHRLKTDGNGLCPACRKPYSENPAHFEPLSEDEIVRIKKERRQKEIQKKQKLTENRRHLADVRVVQKNLVFVVGLSPRLADLETLKKSEYFGKFGKILKIVINPSPSYAGTQTPSASAYLTYSKAEEALRAIQAVNNLQIDNRTLKASLGTTKYCTHFLKSVHCSKPDCMYLHDLGEEAASFTKEEMSQGKHLEYEAKLIENLLHIPQRSKEASQESAASSKQAVTTHQTTESTTTTIESSSNSDNESERKNQQKSTPKTSSSDKSNTGARSTKSNGKSATTKSNDQNGHSNSSTSSHSSVNGTGNGEQEIIDSPINSEDIKSINKDDEYQNSDQDELKALANNLLHEEDLGFDPWRESNRGLQDLLRTEKTTTNSTAENTASSIPDLLLTTQNLNGASSSHHHHSHHSIHNHHNHHHSQQSNKNDILSQLEFFQKQLSAAAPSSSTSSTIAGLNTDLLRLSLSEHMMNGQQQQQQQLHVDNLVNGDESIVKNSISIPPPGFNTDLKTTTSSKQQLSGNRTPNSSSNQQQQSMINGAQKLTGPSLLATLLQHQQQQQQQQQQTQHFMDNSFQSKNFHNALKSILPNANISIGGTGGMSAFGNNTFGGSSISPNGPMKQFNNESSNNAYWHDDPAIITSLMGDSVAAAAAAAAANSLPSNLLNGLGPNLLGHSGNIGNNTVYSNNNIIDNLNKLNEQLNQSYLKQQQNSINLSNSSNNTSGDNLLLMAKLRELQQQQQISPQQQPAFAADTNQLVQLQQQLLKNMYSQQYSNSLQQLNMQVAAAAAAQGKLMSPTNSIGLAAAANLGLLSPNALAALQQQQQHQQQQFLQQLTNSFHAANPMAAKSSTSE